MAQLNGRPVTLDELQTLALTNYGSFTSLRVEDGHVRGLALHLDRLVRDSRILFGADLDAPYVRELIRRAAPANGSTTIRVTVFDPATDLGHPDRATDPQILVTPRPAGALPLPALTVQSTTATYATCRASRASVSSAPCTTAGPPSSTATTTRSSSTQEGVITEGGTWNVGFFDGDRVIWPDAAALPGVTMLLLQGAHEHRARPVRCTTSATCGRRSRPTRRSESAPSARSTKSSCPNPTRSSTRSARSTWTIAGDLL